jgi:hypothetical protein
VRQLEFIALVGGLAAWPVASSAQRRLPRIAVVQPSHPVDVLSAKGNQFFEDSGCRLVGVELLDEAIDLPSFRHPLRAAYVCWAPSNFDSRG